MDSVADKSQFQIPNFSIKQPIETPIKEITNQTTQSHPKAQTSEVADDFSELIKKGWEIVAARQKAANFLEKK